MTDARINQQERQEPEPSGDGQPPFLIVGASAGGLEAFTELLAALPAEPGLAILFVQHLQASHESMLAEILGRAAKMPVHQAKEGMPVEENHVYVIPPGKVMLYRQGKLALSPRAKLESPFMPFDHLCRSLADIRPNINFDDLGNVIHEVIQKLTPQEVEVQDCEGHWYSLRIRPYITQDSKIDGATITAVDIDALRRSLDQLRQARDFAEGIIETVWEPLIVLDSQLRLQRANRAFYQIFQTSPQESVGKPFFELGWGQLNLPNLRSFLADLPPQMPWGANFELGVDLPGLGRQIKHMSRLLDDLLDISRITQRKIHLNKEPVEVASLVNQVAEMVHPAIEAQKQQLEVEVPDQPLILEADPVRLEQILINLLNNAVKYTPPGGKISLLAKPEGNTLVCRICDTGMGISSEMLPRVFDLFVQADKSLDRAQGGLGIGLTLVRNLVEMHGGTVEAHSAGQGKGSEFIVRLPLPVASAPAPARPPAPGALPVGKGQCILVVDDNPEIAESTAQLLIDFGYETHTALSGPEALAEAKRLRPHAILLDIGLPGMDGYEVARRLRQDPDPKEVLIVAVSGYGSEEDQRQSREAGFDHHLVKPVDAAGFLKVLGTVEKK